MHIFPTDSEVRLSAYLLVNRYKVSVQLLGQLFDAEQRDQANAILQSFGASRLTALDVARLLVQRDGPALFAGSRESIRELRLHLLRQLPDDDVQRLFDRHAPGGTNISSPSHMRKPLADKKWHSGKHWPRDFVRSLGFPDVLAGAAEAERVPTVYDVPPLKIPPKLADFQLGLKAGMLDVLARDGDKTRCVVTLPTGGGKTRVAVEALY